MEEAENPSKSRHGFLNCIIMNIVKVANGKVELRKDNGTLIRTIGNGDAVAAFFNANQTLVVITTNKGKVEIRKDNGTLVRILVNGDATNAYWSGNEIVIQTNKGKTEIRKDNGTLIKIM